MPAIYDGSGSAAQPDSGSLLEEDNREVFSAQFRHPLVQSARGFIDRMERGGSRLFITGWVAKADSGEPAQYVTVLIGGRVCSGIEQEFVVREDVNQHLHLTENTRTGFILSCSLPETAPLLSDIAIVAVFPSGGAFKIDHSSATVAGFDPGLQNGWSAKFRRALYPFPKDSPFAGIYSFEPSYDLTRLSGVTSQFLEEAQVYHAKYNNHAMWTGILKNALASIPPFSAPPDVLDIGSGSGNSVIPLFELYPECRIVAVDISPQLLAILRDQLTPAQRNRCLLVAADASDPVFEEGCFDLVIGAAILHHILDPSRTISSCMAALAGDRAAIFFEPFEAGAAILRLIYGKLLERREELVLSAGVVDAFERLSHDFAVRAGTDKSDPLYRELDDKWLFTRTYFENLPESIPISDISVRSLHASENPFASQVKTHLRLCLGAGPDALPPAAWGLIDEFERILSPELKRELLIEGTVILRKKSQSEARCSG